MRLLTQEEVRDVLQRAEEIHFQSLSPLPGSTDLQAVIHAAEEAGLPREAVEQALRERLDLHSTPAKVGELVFAKSSDGRYYVAEVLSITGNMHRVRFLRGGEHSLTSEELRPCSLLPGAKVVCPWPDWGWWTCTAISYDQDGQKIKVTDGWGGYETFPIGEIRLDPPKPKGARLNLGTKATVFVLGALSGGAIGSLVAWLLMR